MKTDVESFLQDLDGGVFSETLGLILSDVGGAVIDHGKKGKVVIELDLKQIASSHQVAVSHTIRYERPTKRGSVKENATSATPMYVGSGGKMTFFPEKQGQMFNKEGNVAQGKERFPVDPETGEQLGRTQ